MTQTGPLNAQYSAFCDNIFGGINKIGRKKPQMKRLNAH